MEKEEWLNRYKKRMIERGVSEEEAEAATEAMGDDLSPLGSLALDIRLQEIPEDVADEELSYWASDG